MSKSGCLGIGASFGVVSLAFATRETRFPASRESLLEHLKNRKILWTRKRIVDIHRVLLETDVDNVESFADLLSIVANYEDPRIRKLNEFG